MRDTTPSCPERAFPAGLLPLGVQTVLPEWIDYNGHMNVAYYTLAFDKAFDAFLEDWIGIGESFVARARHGPMALQTQIRYLGELLEVEPFRVEAYLVDHDQKRMHFFGLMTSEKTGRLAATFESLGMNVDLETRKSAPYPDWVGGRLARLKTAQAGLAVPEGVGQTLGIRRKA